MSIKILGYPTKVSDTPCPRLTSKSRFLRKLEEMQKKEEESKKTDAKVPTTTKSEDLPIG